MSAFTSRASSRCAWQVVTFMALTWAFHEFWTWQGLGWSLADAKSHKFSRGNAKCAAGYWARECRGEHIPGRAAPILTSVPRPMQTGRVLCAGPLVRPHNSTACKLRPRMRACRASSARDPRSARLRTRSDSGSLTSNRWIFRRASSGSHGRQHCPALSRIGSRDDTRGQSLCRGESSISSSFPPQSRSRDVLVHDVFADCELNLTRRFTRSYAVSHHQVGRSRLAVVHQSHRSPVVAACAVI